MKELVASSELQAHISCRRSHRSHRSQNEPDKQPSCTPSAVVPRTTKATDKSQFERILTGAVWTVYHLLRLPVNTKSVLNVYQNCTKTTLTGLYVQGATGVMSLKRTFTIKALWDDEAKVFVSESDIDGLHIEADTIEEFEKVMHECAVELIVANHLSADDIASLPVRDLVPAIVWQRPEKVMAVA